MALHHLYCLKTPKANALTVLADHAVCPALFAALRHCGYGTLGAHFDNADVQTFMAIDHQQLNVQEAAANKLPADALLMQGLLSIDSQKRNNIHLIDDHTLLTSAGTNVILLDLTTCVLQYISTPVAEGVGALAASADHR